MVNNLVITSKTKYWGLKRYSNKPSMFNILKLSDKIQNVVLDIQNLKDIGKVISDNKPDFFH